jgi:phenol 2-monooxygenase (NADPH)
VPIVNIPVRYPFEILLNQGGVESIFIDSMAEHGLAVGRPVAPASIELSNESEQLTDPLSYPVKVSGHPGARNGSTISIGLL